MSTKTNDKVVPHTLKNTVWKKRFKESNAGMCVCCTCNNICYATFQCGHILSRAKGGTIHKDNLEPICSACNQSMGTRHMFEFMKKYGYEPSAEQKELCEIFDNYFKDREETNKTKTNTDLKTNKKVNKNNKSVFYKKPEIESCVQSILNKFKKYNEREVQVIAPTQSGKSDVIINFIDKITKNQKKYRKEYNIDKIAVIICASDNDLKRDLTNKIKNYDKKNTIKVKHLPDIMNYHKDEEIWGLFKNLSLIIFDENHCDITESAIIDKFRNHMGIGWDHNKWTNNDVKVLGLSATPYEHIHVNIPYVKMTPSDQYYSIEDMMACNKIKQSYDLSNYDNVSKLFEYKKLYSKKGYVIIRLPARNTKPVLNAIKEFMKNKNIKCKIITYDMKEEEDINVSILCNKPNNLVIIYVKDKIRKGKTLNKEYILMMHDRKETNYANTTIQGLLGRGTGYDANKDMILYCKLEHVKQHLKWENNKYDSAYIPTSRYLLNDTLKGTSLKNLIDDDKSDSGNDNDSDNASDNASDNDSDNDSDN